MGEKIGFKILKGANTDVDILAYKIAKKYGIEELKKLTKFHFSNTNKVVKLLEFD